MQITPNMVSFQEDTVECYLIFLIVGRLKHLRLEY